MNKARNEKFRNYTRKMWEQVENVWEFDSFEEKEETIRFLREMLDTIYVRKSIFLSDPDDRSRAEAIGLRHNGWFYTF